MEIKGSQNSHKEMGKGIEGHGCQSFGNPGGNIKKYLRQILDGPFLPEEEYMLIKLKSERNKLLKFQEEQWCLKSRAIWIHNGDKNTKFSIFFLTIRESTNIFGRSKMIEVIFKKVKIQ